MSTWKLARLSKTCALTGKPLPPDPAVVAALYGVEEEVGEDKVKGVGFVRKDFLADAVTPEALAGAFCVWRTRTPPENPNRPPRLDVGMAREMLERLVAENSPDRAAVSMTLAYLLVRKRRLNLVSERAGELVLRWPREKDTFRVPAVEVTEAESESLQQELLRLFDV